MLDLTRFSLRLNNVIGWMRWLGLMAVIWSALVAGSLAWYMHLQQQNILNAASVAARANINKDISFRNWAATHGGVYVPPTEHTPPNPYLHVPDRDVVTTTGKTLTLMNPAYMLRQLQSDFPSDYGTKSHITSLKPINPNNAPDAWETKALHAFEQGGKELLEAQQIDGQPYLRMMLPLIVEQGCLKCHAQQGYKLDDIRGGIGSAVHLSPFLAREREFRGSLILGHGAIWLIGLAGLAWMGVSFRRVEYLKIISSTAEAVEKSERRFRAIAQSANDAIISADSAGKVVDWNPSAERLFGYSCAEIIGQPLTVLMPERFRDPHRAGLARVMAGGAPHVIGKAVELAGVRKDGSEFPLELSLAQWSTADGQFFTAMIRDVTERKRIELALRESEERFRVIFEAAQDGIVLTDAQSGLVVNCNPEFERQCGRSLAQIKTLHIWELRPPEQQEDAHRKFEEIKTTEHGSADFGFQRPDGTYQPTEVVATRVRICNRNYLLSISRDITERKQAEAKLVEQLDELRRWHNITSGREERILVLKHEINDLLAQAGQPPRYPSAES